MAIQLLISDLDGTLLGPESVITPGTAAALERARQAGLRLLVTTGRAWGTAAPLQALAERVIEPNTEDGVAREIERLLMEK